MKTRASENRREFSLHLKNRKRAAMRVLGGAGVPAGAIFDTMELTEEADFERRGIMQTMEHPIAGPFKMPGWPVRFGGRTPDVNPSPPPPKRVRLRVLSMAEDPAHTAPTLFLLMAQYNGQTVVPLDQVCRDFFGHLTVEKLLRKALRGDIALPIVRIETSQKAQRGVHLVDLAAYIDKRRAAAVKECRQLTGTI
jgi:hypothetical protein